MPHWIFDRRNTRGINSHIDDLTIMWFGLSYTPKKCSLQLKIQIPLLAKLLDLNCHYYFGKFHEFNNSESVGYINTGIPCNAFLSTNNLLLLA